MKIALTSSPFFGVPPARYGGLERVVWDLACGLIELGHKVVVFAPKGSQVPPGGFVVEVMKPLETTNADWLKAEQDVWTAYKGKLTDIFDIIHCHDWYGIPYASRIENPKLKICHTHHGHMDPNYWLRTKPPFKLNWMGISDFMKREYEQMGMPARFTYNGIDITMYPFEEHKGDRLLFVGRLSMLKRPDIAIDLAQRLGLGIDIVGGSFVAPQEMGYLEEIKKRCVGNVQLYLDATDDVKVGLMQKAKAVVCPSGFAEPFNLVCAEANACGTPVIATPDGGIPEVIKDGSTGIICKNIDEMVSRFGEISEIHPEDCRMRATTMFSREAMAKGYLAHYEEILKGDEW